MPRWRSALAVACLLVPTLTTAQSRPPQVASVKRYADGVLALMCFSVVPDLTSSFLSIGSGSAGTTSLAMTQVAGGATISKDLPLYLEGGAAYSRYDPTFVISQGAEEREIPAKWTSVSGTAGIGWDFPLTDELVLRPIFNFALGRVSSDLAVLAWWAGNQLGADTDFLDSGRLNAYGLGGSLMLDYELKRPEHEIDVEWRYTWIRLRSFGSSSEAVEGSATASTSGVWARWRAPTGLQALERPLRYVLEAAHTTYWGDNANLLGFNNLSSVGVGLELDSSAYDVFITRTRLVARYAFGHNVTGFAIGLAVSF